MKKSEAIEKLILWAKSNPDIVDKSVEEQFGELLNFMVDKLGMLPPEAVVRTLTIPEFSSGYKVVNEWEDEDVSEV